MATEIDSHAAMLLPAGKTCADCVHYLRCNGLFGITASSLSCDFFPNRFEQAAVVEVATDLRPHEYNRVEFWAMSEGKDVSTWIRDALLLACEALEHGAAYINQQPNEVT
jgi:hypothetical protein